MCIGKSNNDVMFVLGSEDLTIVKQLKDLGINVCNGGKCNTPIDHITSRAHSRANLVHKCFCLKTLTQY